MARIFAVTWILLGLIIMGIFSSNITSGLTTLSLQLERTNLADVKVCAILCPFLIYLIIMHWGRKKDASVFLLLHLGKSAYSKTK